MRKDTENVITFGSVARAPVGTSRQSSSAQMSGPGYGPCAIVSGAGSWYHEEALREADTKRKR